MTLFHGVTISLGLAVLPVTPAYPRHGAIVALEAQCNGRASRIVLTRSEVDALIDVLEEARA